MSRGVRLALLALFVLGFTTVTAFAARHPHFRDPEMDAKYQEVFRNQDLVREKYAALYAQGPVVELITMGIGSLAWERHGHIAVCIVYPDEPKWPDDTCYNYGIGDFHEPLKMAMGFLKGKKSFWVGTDSPEQMFAVYLHFDRTIWMQPVPLTLEETQFVIDKLEYDILDEHKYYAYDHFWDNCTTRVRDILDNATHGKLKALDGDRWGRTYRDMARDGFAGMDGLGNGRIGLLVADLFLGRVTDQVPSYWDRMFLPDYLREGVRERFNVDPVVLYQRKTGFNTLNGQVEIFAQHFGLPPPRHGPSGRFELMLAMLVLTAPAWLSRLVKRFDRLGLALAIIPPVLLGGVIWFIVIVSPLPYLRWNEVALILMPIDLIVVFLRYEQRRLYALGRIGMLALMAVLMLIHVMHQPVMYLLLWPLIPLATVAFMGPPPSALPKAAAKK